MGQFETNLQPVLMINIFYSPKLSLTWIHIYLFIYKAGGRGNKTPQFKLFNVDLQCTIFCCHKHGLNSHSTETK